MYIQYQYKRLSQTRAKWPRSGRFPPVMPFCMEGVEKRRRLTLSRRWCYNGNALCFNISLFHPAFLEPSSSCSSPFSLLPSPFSLSLLPLPPSLAYSFFFPFSVSSTVQLINRRSTQPSPSVNTDDLWSPAVRYKASKPLERDFAVPLPTYLN